MSRLLMLRADWPASFRRTVRTGRKPKLLTFEQGKPVKVSDQEFEALRPDIGLAIFEATLDEQGRPRMIIGSDPPKEVATRDENLSG